MGTPAPKSSGPSQPPGNQASNSKRTERAAPTKSFAPADVWELIHTGDFWMDGISTLNPDKQPLWKGFIDMEDITPDHAPPHYRQLTTEQYEVLQRLLEVEGYKVFPSEAFGRWWPRHFTLNGKARGIKTAPISAEKALHMPDEKPLVRTFMFHGRPMQNLPKEMIENTGAPFNMIMTLEQSKAVEELKGKMEALKTRLKARDNEVKRQRDSAKEEAIKHEQLQKELTDLKDQNQKLKEEVREFNQASLPLPPGALEHIHLAIQHLKQITSPSVAITGLKELPKQTETNKRLQAEALANIEADRNKRRKVSQPAPTALEILRNRSKLPYSGDGAQYSPPFENPDETPSQHTEEMMELMDMVIAEKYSGAPPPPQQRRKEVVTMDEYLDHNSQNPLTPIKTIMSGPLGTSDAEIKDLLDHIAHHILHHGSGASLWDKKDYFDLLKKGASYATLLLQLKANQISVNESLLEKEVAILVQRWRTLPTSPRENRSQEPSYTPDPLTRVNLPPSPSAQLSMAPFVPINQTRLNSPSTPSPLSSIPQDLLSARGQDSEGQVPIPQSGPSPLSRKEYPHFFELKRQARYLTLQALNAFTTTKIFAPTTEELKTLTPEHLQRSDRLFLKTIVEGYQPLIQEIALLCEKTFLETFSLEGIDHPSEKDSPILMFNSSDILEFSQASLFREERKELRKIAFDLTKRMNSDKAPSAVGKVLPRDFVFESINSFLSLLQAKGMNPPSREELLSAWNSYLQQIIPQTAEEPVDSQLLIFQMLSIDRFDRAEMEEALFSHLRIHNESFSPTKETLVFPSNTFTFRELRAFLEGNGWNINECDLAKELSPYNAPDY